jgi:hypothetical protein
VKFALEEVLGLYSIFGEEILLEISSNLAVRLGAGNILSTHTCPQVGPDLDTLGYQIPLLAVIVLESFKLNLT